MANYRAIARNRAAKYGLDPDIFERQINQESGFNPSAGSPAGAQGIAQIMPATAKSWGVNPMDPVAALDAAAKNMAKYVKQYGGSYEKALAAYNAGAGAVAKYGGVPPFAETQNYVKKILGGRGSGGHTGGNPAAAGGSSAPSPVASSAQDSSGDRMQRMLDTFARMNKNVNQPLPGITPSAGAKSLDEMQTQSMDMLRRIMQQRSQPTPVGPQQMGAAATGSTPSLKGQSANQIANALARRYHLSVTSEKRTPQQNSAVGGSPTSLHLSNRAADLGGSPQNLRRAFNYLEKKYPGVTEAFYDPIGHYLKKGKRVPGAIGGHGDHLHIGV